MEELINKLKEISSLSELENLISINANDLLYAIVKSGRFELLNGANIRLDTSNRESLEKIVEYLLSDVEMLYDIHMNGFSFSKEELNAMFTIVLQKYHYSYEFGEFLDHFFGNIDELNDFVKEHEQQFENYVNEKDYSISYKLEDCDNFVALILNGNHSKLVNHIENYSVTNLKLLVQYINRGNEIQYYQGNERFARHLFEVKSELDFNEFSILLSLLKEKVCYNVIEYGMEEPLFPTLVKENIDYLIEVVSKSNIMPMCLAESTFFRDECIRRNRIDLAVKCILPPDIFQNEELINAYCKELNIEPKDFYERSKWLLNYHEKNNNNIFNTFLAKSLKDNIFNLNQEHFERFINDLELQMAITKLNDKELNVFSKILNIYNYKDYDISLMIVNVINNIGNYQELINSLDIENIGEQDLRKIVSVLQFPNNQYQINDLNTLQNYDVLKKQYFINNYSNDSTINKDDLLKALFNIDLKEAKYINYKYCYDDEDNSMLENLRNSELPQQIYNYLAIINKIVECDNKDELISLYNSLKDTTVYDLEIPLETYLRAQYTNLYSKSLYRIDEKNQVYGPVDNITKEINYNGKNIQVCVPRVNFNFLIHCVGSCSLESEVVDKNYRNDWLDRPQIQDHFVACSYINERGIFSVRSHGSIIFGFDTLEGGSIMGMGDTDIDSIGRYANSYNGARELQEGNANRARFFVPSVILKSVNRGYNEIVVERRNTDESRSQEFKRKPDYIIMMVESMEQDNFNYLNSLFQNQLSFISDEDKNVIREIGDSRELKEFLEKYSNIISELAASEGISLKSMTNKFANLIMNAKYYEDCLKAASEFDIPLVVVDKTYYFNKILNESGLYDEETLNRIFDYFSKASESTKSEMFNMAARGEDVSQILKPKEPIRISISI